MENIVEETAVDFDKPFAKPFAHSRALLDAALAEFAAAGYEQASINTILAKAGMSKGQFYYHFGNKEGLYLALIDVLVAQKQAFLAQQMTPQDLHGDLFTIFKTQIKYSMMFARAYPAIHAFSQSFMREQGNAIYEKALAMYNFENNAGINSLIDAALQKGELRDDLPPAFIKKIIGHLFTHAAEFIPPGEPHEIEQSLTHLISVMKSGLGHSPSRA